MQSSHEENIQAILQEVWGAFRREGITSNNEIIEYISSLLLHIEHIQSTLAPRIPRVSRDFDEEHVSALLTDAVAQAQGSGDLFDRYVLFQSFDTRKDTYPIPRHIVRFMLKILAIKPEESFADFTCGSGGFLLHRNHGKPSSGLTVGVEISPEWGRIASANIALHQREDTQLYVGDAFRVCTGEGQMADVAFDSIAMAPPFGIAIDQQTALETMGVTNGRSSEILFTRLALKKLVPQGRAAIMVPDTLLSSKRASEKLKQDLLAGHTLQAVIALGEGALYPFNALSVSVLLIAKQHQPEIQPWLFNVANDGYPRRRNRDITREPEPNNDLSFVASVLELNENAIPPVPVQEQSVETSLFSVVPILLEASSTLVGFVIKVTEEAMLASIWRVEEQVQESTRSYFLARASVPGQGVRYIAIPLHTTGFDMAGIQEGEDDAEWLKTLSPQRYGMAVFASRTPGQTVAILLNGRLLGCTRPVEEIIENGYTLRPQDYLSRVEDQQPLNPVHLGLTETSISKGATPVSPSEAQEFVDDLPLIDNARPSAPTVPPAKTLNEIKRQVDLTWRYASYLQDVLETRSFKALPPRRLDFTTFALLHHLGQEQHEIWEAIQTFVDSAGHPLYFTPKRLLQIVRTDSVKLQHTLDLLLQAGVVIRVHIQRSDNNIIICYRLPTENDVIQQEENIYAAHQDQN
jgi:hypothetical protein